MLEARLKLKDGETLKRTGSRTKGPLQETDITSYVILDAQGKEIGTVEHTEHTAIKGFKQSERIVRRDMAGTIVTDETA
jgi:hypothetical protein